MTRPEDGTPMLAAPAALLGEGLLLRPWALEDAAALEEACGDADICRFTTVPRRYSLAEARSWIERQHGRLADGGVVLAVVPDLAARPVGMVALFGLGRPDPPPRFGYWVIGEFRGRGLAERAARTLGRWARAEHAVQTLIIDVEPANAASHRVAAKLGAQPVGEVSAGGVPLIRYTVSSAAL